MKTVVACPIEASALEPIKHWLRARRPEEGPVDFVHIIRRVVYAADLMVAVESPTPEQFKLLKEALSEYLRHQLFPCLPQENRGTSQVHVVLALDEAEEMVHYLKTQKAALVVVSTRDLKGFKGLFTSSFAQRMLKEAPCNALILRP